MLVQVSGKMAISIHAPTRGATIDAINEWKQMLFQSTLPQGERRRVIALAHIIKNFNPRSHKGSDTDVVAEQVGFCISIHAPTRGATSISSGIFSNPSISIHAPTRGATEIPDLEGAIYALFQSTLPQGERRCSCRILYNSR